MYNNYHLQKKGIYIEKKGLDWLWYVMVFLFSINFFGLSNILLISLVLIGLIMVLYKKSTLKLTFDLVIITLFSISYFLTLSTYVGGSLGSLLMYMIGPWLFFLIGYTLVKTRNEIIYKTTLLIALGNFFHGFFNMLMYFSLHGFKPSINGLRVIPDFWTGLGLTSTLQGAKYSLVASLLFFVVLNFIGKNNIKESLIIFGAIMFSLMATFIMGNRTLVVIIIISFITSLLSYTVLTRKNVVPIIRVSLFIIVLSIGLFFIYMNNGFNMKTFVEGSTWYNRSGEMIISEDPRFMVYHRAFYQMFHYPFGGFRMDLGLGYAHNLWIDVLHATGLIPFILLVIYTLKSINNLTILLTNKYYSIEFKIFIISIYSGFILTFMVEPILEGLPYMFLSYCLVNGMISKHITLISDSKNLKRSNLSENKS